MDHRYVHPKLMPYITALISHSFGLQGAKAEIRNVESGNIFTRREKNNGDRFLLIITYCTTRLTWQVIMCPNDLNVPPDFIMQEDFLANMDVSIIESQVPSLAYWQASDPKSLLNVVLELLQLYKQYQGNLLTLNQESRFCIEYTALSNYLADPINDLEICVHYQSRVSFLTHLKIDFSKLLTPLPKLNYLILLLIELGDNTKNTVSLIKQAELDAVFGNIDLPELKADMMLVEYIPILQNYLQKKVDNIVYRLNQRKTLYSLLYQAFEPSLLNGDNITFHNISFLIELDGLYYIVLIEISINFPTDPPKLAISSMKRHKSGQELICSLKINNYNPDWSMQTIFKKLFDVMNKHIFLSQNKTNISTNDPHPKKN